MQSASKRVNYIALFATIFVANNAHGSWTIECSDPKKTVYLTFDTGHMRVAPLVADVLTRQGVKVTFFVANEATNVQGDTSRGASLDAQWAPWWRARALEGHAFASHTFNHSYWQADVGFGPTGASAAIGQPHFLMKPSAGPAAGKTAQMTAEQYCNELRQPMTRLKQIEPSIDPMPLFRAPGGKISPALLRAAETCGMRHVGWSAAGFLGDELPSDRYPNTALLHKALRDVKGGDVLLAHLGIWSRKDPWAPAVLEPLIVGLKSRGFCFATLREHPIYGRVATVKGS